MDSNIFKNQSSNTLKTKSKIKLFLVFSFISFLFWIFTKFSKNYSELVFFEVKYENIPDLILVDSEYNIIEGYINSSGFQIFLYRLMPKTLFVDISLADFQISKGEIDLSSQRRSLDDQINGSFLSFETDKLFFNYSSLKTKKVKVKIDSKFEFASGYSNMNDQKIEPDSIVISGPDSIIENIDVLITEPIEMQNISNDIQMTVSVLNNYSNVLIKPSKVFFKESVKRFTEQDFEVLINIINAPDSIEIKLFPEKVNLTSSFPIEYIDKLRSSDFELVFDYFKTENGQFESISLDLINSPKMSKNTRWEPKTISYLFKK